MQNFMKSKIMHMKQYCDDYCVKHDQDCELCAIIVRGGHDEEYVQYVQYQ